MLHNLNAYMGGRFDLINHALRQRRVRPNRRMNSVDASDMEKSVLTIDAELDSLGKPVRTNCVVYRNAGPVSHYGSPHVRAPNFVYEQLAYLSTSRNPRYSWDQRNRHCRQLLFMTIRCGAMGYGRDVMHVRRNMNEAEVLFHRNVRFRITAVTRDRRGNVHWQMTETISPNAGYVWGAHHT